MVVVEDEKDRVQQNEAGERTMMKRNRVAEARKTMMRRLILTRKRTRRPSLRGADVSERNYYR